MSSKLPPPSKRSPTYRSWGKMLKRCYNPNDDRYDRYGGRGITVCDRWRPKAGGSFANFLADMGERPEGHGIGRIDNDGNYEPSNCRWETPKDQAQNRSTNRANTPFHEKIKRVKHRNRERVRRERMREERNR